MQLSQLSTVKYSKCIFIMCLNCRLNLHVCWRGHSFSVYCYHLRLFACTSFAWFKTLYAWNGIKMIVFAILISSVVVICKKESQGTISLHLVAAVGYQGIVDTS